MKRHELSHSQLLIWTGQQLNPTSPLYNMAFRFNFRNGIDEDRFAEAVNNVVAENEVLRSVYLLEDGSPKVVFPEKVDSFHETLKVGGEEVDAWVAKKAKEVFNLEERSFYSALIKIDDGPHVWFVNQHHIITDGWSFTLFYDQVMSLYLEMREGSSHSYSKYLESGGDDRAEKSVDYWADQLGKTNVPHDYHGKGNEDLKPESSRYKYVLRADILEKLERVVSKPGLRTWSRELGLFNAFLTVLAVSSYRINGQRSKSIGVPALNRLNRVEKETLGLFIEMFPIATQIGSGETYETLYKKINLSANGFLKHAKRGLSSPDLLKTFNLVLNFINAKFSSFPGIEMDAEWVHPGAGDPGHSLRLQVTNFNDDDSLTLLFDFNDSVFNVMERTSFMEHFINELQNFTEDETQLLRPQEEKERALIASVNKTDTAYPTGATILDIFSENLAELSPLVAVKAGKEQLTFAELDFASNQLAHKLRQSDIGREVAVGVKIERSLEMMIALLGIIKAGGAYVPIDPGYPKDRVDFMVEDAEIPLIVDKAYISDISNYSGEELPDKPVANELIYIIYTSGSTGKPKGVMNEHGGVLNRLLWARDEFQLTSDDKILQKTNYTFDVSVGELFLPLLTGATLVMAEPGGHRDADYLKQVIEEERITSIHFVPPMLELFLLNAKPGECSSLRYISCTGEILSLDNARKCKELFPDVTIYNLYGPTEAAVEVTMWKSPPSLADLTSVTIGKPFANVKIRIVDENNQDCGMEVPGELLIGGIQVARGYMKRPSLSNEKFIQEGSMRWYRTGDLCQWLPTGEIEFFGRMDSQVKVRGFRVELEEIERVAEELDEVQDCIVVLNDKRIVAFAKVSSEIDIRKHLMRKLPDYMVPSQVHMVEKVPYLNNGKIDRKRLLAGISEQKASNKPENEFQEFVAGIWAETLNIAEIDIKDNFFSLGGDSLSGIRVITHINAELDLELPVVLIFTRPTVETLAVEIEAEIDKRMMEA